MHFKTNKKNILPLLHLLNGIIEKKQTLPILSHCLLFVENNNLFLTGSDLEIELNLSLEVEMIRPGSITISEQKLFDICRSFLDDTNIEIKTSDNDKVIITAGKSKFSLSSLPATNYPKAEVHNTVNQIAIAQKEIVKLFNDVAFSMALQDVRYYLNGLLLEIDQQTISVVATDGHRLAMSRKDIATTIENKLQIIIPRKAVMEIMKILSLNEQVVTIKFSDNQILLHFGSSSLIVRLVDGKYPDYEKVIPKNSDKEILIEKDIFISSLQRAAILSNEKYKGIKLLFSNHKIQISAHNSNHEQANDEIETSYEYEPLEIGFNAPYLLEIINAVSSKKVKIRAKNKEDSWLIQNQEDSYPVYVIMPMSL